MAAAGKDDIIGVMIAREEKSSGPRYLSASVLITAAVMASAGAATNVSAAAITAQGRCGRAVAQREPAARWLHSLTDAARRLHGQNIAAIGRQLCALPADEPADRTQPAPAAGTVICRTHFIPQLIDLPPPATASA